MSDAAEKEAPYTPPPAAWRLPLLLEATPAQLAAKVVECKTCPVFLQCEAGEGGTGYVCQTCKSTGVWTSEPETNVIPKDVLILDCAKHKFHTDSSKEPIKKCPACTGQYMEMMVLKEGAEIHYVTTAYATVSAADRQKLFREQFAYWTKYHSEEEKKKRKEAGEE